MSLKVDIVGMPELKRFFEKAPEEIKQAIHNELKVVAADLQGKAQKLTPVDTGDLQGSAYSEVENLEGTVGFTEIYALRQHEEMDYNHPKGGQAKYLEQPYKENMQKYIDDIANAIKRAVGG